MLLLQLTEIFGDVSRIAERLFALTGDDYVYPGVLTCERLADDDLVRFRAELQWILFTMSPGSVLAQLVLLGVSAAVLGL